MKRSLIAFQALLASSAVLTGKADIACGVAFTWGRSTK